MGAFARVGLLVFLAVAIGLVAYYFENAQQSQAVGHAPSEHEIRGLVVQTKDLEAGEIWEQKDFAWKLPIENRTGRAIAIKQLQTSCGCLSVEPKSLTIPARESKIVSLAFDTRNRDPNAIGDPTRDFVETVEPNLEGPDASATVTGRPYWTLKGSVRRRVTFDVVRVTFGDSPVQGRSPAARRILMIVHVPFRDIKARIQPPVASVRTVKTGENRFELWVAPRTDARPGRFCGELTVDMMDKEGTTFEAGWLAIEGEVRAEVRPIPARLILPARKIGETADGMFLLQGSDDAEIKVESIATDSPEVHVEAVEIPGAASGRAYRVRVHLTSVGDFSSRACFTVRRPGQPAAVYSMEIFSRGLARATP